MLCKLLIATLAFAALTSPSYAWVTLTPTIQNFATDGDPHDTTILDVMLIDRGPLGTGAQIGPPQTYPVVAVAGQPPVKWGPIPESGDCLRVLSIVIRDMWGTTTTKTSPYLYDTCHYKGFQVHGGPSWSVLTLAVTFIYN